MTFRRLFGRESKVKAAQLPAGHRLYAVGDVHGRDDLLEQLLERIESDNAARKPAKTVLLFLGDLIDRGPSSAQVIERLSSYQPEGFRLVFLSGNHEEVLLSILDGEMRLLPEWLRFGGAECLASYGVDQDKIRRIEPRRALPMIRDAIPAKHVEFVRAFDDTFRAGGYLFVHAGIRPGVPLEEQSQSDLRWIREPFLSDGAEHGFLVVHGHTVREEVEERVNRIGIDTGAYRHGVLTAIGLEGADRWFVQATDSAATESDSIRNRKVSSALD